MEDQRLMATKKFELCFLDKHYSMKDNFPYDEYDLALYLLD